MCYAVFGLEFARLSFFSSFPQFEGHTIRVLPELLLEGRKLRDVGSFLGLLPLRAFRDNYRVERRRERERLSAGAEAEAPV